ncbi:hypothetical protein BDA99DRAFT_517622 [Phascolomyces articulosus]|uniref:Protein SMG9 n=1 Tax=Phascolomyces articulosus TaxID=60185 RepID=A0AAD5K4T8_9FUNG|nr:hypothetical protein BDA99DRAFT_517622 [Phascolomyces articulosus]
MGSSKRGKDRRPKQQSDHSKPFLHAPVILERRDRTEVTESTSTTTRNAENTDIRLAPKPNNASASTTPIPTQPESFSNLTGTATTSFFGKQGKVPSEVAHKLLGESPGHFVVGVVGQQGVGKSTVLSWFTQEPSNAFPIESPESVAYSRHQTSGIDILISPERTILLDTEPLLSSSVLDETLRAGSMDGLHPEVWLEMESLYNLVFMLSICNVVLVVSEGSEIDHAMVKLLRRATMVKFNIPDFPLIPPASFGQAQVDTNYYPDIVFVCNKCRDWEFQWRKYADMQVILHEAFMDSNLKTSGLVSLEKVLPAFEGVEHSQNVFFLPYSPNDSMPRQQQDIWNVNDRSVSGIESFETLMQALREQVIGAPRRPGKKGQVSEKDWYKNAIKIHELIRKSEYIADYVKTVMKMVQK